MKVLICNAGSTSLKFCAYEMPAEETLARGRVERIGSNRAIFHYDDPQKHVLREPLTVPDYSTGISLFLSELSGCISREEIAAVGFKTVLSKDHYGVHELTEEVLEGMRAFLPVAPVHNTCYLEAIRAIAEQLPNARRIGVFETAFHTTIPIERRIYPIPYEWYEKFGIMRMGYHGASHSYSAKKLGAYPRLISCHLGGSSSLCAILNGKSMDNSFGFSLQAGIPHAVRTGDMDVYILPYLQALGMEMSEIIAGLEKNGGLKGLSGTSGDLRDVLQAIREGSDRAKLAFDVLITAIVRYIGAYTAELGGCDAIAFTGGIGENSPEVRSAVLDKLRYMGVQIDVAANEGGKGEREITAADSAVKAFVIPADEECVVVEKTYQYILDNR